MIIINYFHDLDSVRRISVVVTWATSSFPHLRKHQVQENSACLQLCRIEPLKYETCCMTVSAESCINKRGTRDNRYIWNNNDENKNAIPVVLILNLNRLPLVIIGVKVAFI